MRIITCDSHQETKTRRRTKCLPLRSSSTRWNLLATKSYQTASTKPPILDRRYQTTWGSVSSSLSPSSNVELTTSFSDGMLVLFKSKARDVDQVGRLITIQQQKNSYLQIVSEFFDLQVLFFGEVANQVLIPVALSWKEK